MTSLNGTMVPIETVEVGAGGQAAIEFTNIPQTYTDLYILSSLRTNRTEDADNVKVTFNNSATGYSVRNVVGTGSGTNSTTNFGQTEFIFVGQYAASATLTASTFSNNQIYIPNYTSSNNKSVSMDSVVENNGTFGLNNLAAGLWSNSAAITSISLVPAYGTLFVQHSTATLYGVKNYALTQIDDGAKASGGIVTSDANYWYHTFTTSGTFTPTQNLTANILVVAGGGSGGGNFYGAGGGAGGLLGHTSQSLNATNYTVTVGAGGTFSSNGNNSQFGSLTASIGGGSAGRENGGVAAGSGGSGGGGSGTGGAGSGTSGQGNAGGAGPGSTNGAGGGGGATQAGSSGNGGAVQVGGNGSSAYSSWGLVTETGHNVNGTVWYAGGGATQGMIAGLGGGGGSNRTGTTNAEKYHGMANTGGGGGGAGDNNGYNGGSGIVIVRYAK